MLLSSTTLATISQHHRQATLAAALAHTCGMTQSRPVLVSRQLLCPNWDCMLQSRETNGLSVFHASKCNTMPASNQKVAATIVNLPRQHQHVCILRCTKALTQPCMCYAVTVCFMQPPSASTVPLSHTQPMVRGPTHRPESVRTHR